MSLVNFILSAQQVQGLLWVVWWLVCKLANDLYRCTHQSWTGWQWPPCYFDSAWHGIFERLTGLLCSKVILAIVILHDVLSPITPCGIFLPFLFFITDLVSSSSLRIFMQAVGYLYLLCIESWVEKSTCSSTISYSRKTLSKLSCLSFLSCTCWHSKSSTAWIACCFFFHVQGCLVHSRYILFETYLPDFACGEKIPCNCPDTKS